MTSVDVREETTLEEVVRRITDGTFYDDYDWASGPALRALTAQLEIPPRENNKPPVHWKPNPRYEQPQTVEEWDWRQDGAASDNSFDRSWKRLTYAYVRADPHAPDQMALVVRGDLGRILGRLTHYTAHRELLMEQKGEHDRRVTELLAANNREVENRRMLAAVLRKITRDRNARVHLSDTLFGEIEDALERIAR